MRLSISSSKLKPVSPNGNVSIINGSRIMVAQSFNVDPNEYSLFKTNWLEEPIQRLKNDKNTMRKEHVRSGDILVLKNKKEVIVDEKLIVHIHYSKSGLPSDQQYSGMLSLTEDITLNQLKEQIADSGIVPFITKGIV